MASRLKPGLGDAIAARPRQNFGIVRIEENRELCFVAMHVGDAGRLGHHRLYASL